jgi:glycosyltransferase involved in cell wall biosynthesis
MRAVSGLDIKAFIRFIRFLRSNHFDLIHNNTRTYFGHLALIFAARGTPRLYQEHGDLHNEGDIIRSSLSYRLFHHFYDSFLTVSDFTKKCMERAGVSSQRITNIGNPIDFEYFKPQLLKADAKRKLGFSSDTSIVGTACRFVHEKDLPLFLRTAKEIHSSMPDVHFALVGGGPEERMLRNLVAELGLQLVVHFVEIRSDMPVVFRAFDVFLLTSYQESFGKTILECLASATPIVAVVPGYGGGKEIVEKSKGILFTYERNSAELAKLAMSLLTDPNRREEVGNSGRLWVLSQTEFHVNEWAERLENVYTRLLHMQPMP